MSARKRKDYDDDELVMAIAQGSKTYTQIARDFGISRTMLYYIISGKERPELQPKLKAATELFRQQAGRLVVRMGTLAITRLAQLLSPGSEASAEVQRKAAVDILRFVLGPPTPVHVTIPVFGADPDLLALTGVTRRRVLLELGGPPTLSVTQEEG